MLLHHRRSHRHRAAISSQMFGLKWREEIKWNHQEQKRMKWMKHAATMKKADYDRHDESIGGGERERERTVFKGRPGGYIRVVKRRGSKNSHAGQKSRTADSERDNESKNKSNLHRHHHNQVKLNESFMSDTCSDYASAHNNQRVLRLQ